jgi:hypothetical protein
MLKRTATLLTLASCFIASAVALTASPDDEGQVKISGLDSTRTSERAEATSPGPLATDFALSHAHVRMMSDLAAIQGSRPGYSFWQHIFTIPDGRIAYGSAQDGRLLAVFPATGDWRDSAVWKESRLSTLLRGQTLPRRLDDRRDAVARLLEADLGPVLHNPTRGNFLLPNVDRYAPFLSEWGAIYERFGVPADLGLAQAVVESGLNGTIRSEARAIGFCQWLQSNWKRLQRHSPHVIEGYNQTTQAPYCAAYLVVLATKYGSFIPALSEHHAGGTNVGRLLINGERLGGEDVRTQYLLGSEFTREVRLMAPRSYRDVYGSYGPRSFFYAEMVFGNTFTVGQLRDSTPQRKIYAMRTTRALTLGDVSRRTGLSTAEIKRYNPALQKQVPARSTVYLPKHVSQFGADVAFWHRPPGPAFSAVLNEFLQLNATFEEWDSPALATVLEGFAERFGGTGSEEGTVMATVLRYLVEDIRTSGRGDILTDFRTSDRIRRLFDAAVLERAGTQAAQAAAQ